MVRNGHVDPGRHDLADVHVPQVGQGLNDDALLLRGLGVLGRLWATPVRSLVLGRSAPGPTGPAGCIGWRLRLPGGRHAVPDQLVGSLPAWSWGPAPTSTGTGDIGIVGVGPVVEEGVDGPPQAEGIERLDQPALGAGAPGQEDVGPAVQQHQHGDVVQGVVGLLQAELEADGHAAHVAHLHVDDDQIGRFLGDEGHDLGSRGHGMDRHVGATDDGLDLTAEGRRIAGDQNGLHGGETIGPQAGCGSPSSRTTGSAQSKRTSAARSEPDQVVDVVAEEGDPARRAPARPAPPARRRSPPPGGPPR